MARIAIGDMCVGLLAVEFVTSVIAVKLLLSVSLFRVLRFSSESFAVVKRQTPYQF